MVAIYGKEGCERCEKAKEKMEILGIPYSVHSAEYHTTPHEGWKTDGSIDVLAASVMDESLPLIRVGGQVLGYAEAMRALKKARAAL